MLGAERCARRREQLVARATVLIVEDDPVLVRVITRNLVARGYATDSAPTVARAIEVVHRDLPALLLLDIDLPDGVGWDALRTTDGVGVPVIVMSALRPNPRLCAELRVAGVLEKPFTMELLVRLVATCSGRSATPLSTTDDDEEERP